MNKYKRLYEKDETIKLSDKSLVDKLIKWFIENPYPQDHSGLHKFAESLGMDADILETYIYAMLSCFLVGGNYNKSGKKESDFSEEEKKMGVKVEAEHIDTKNDNEVVKYIAEYYKNRIANDHLADNPKYYSQAKAGTLQIEELAK